MRSKSWLVEKVRKRKVGANKMDQIEEMRKFLDSREEYDIELYKKCEMLEQELSRQFEEFKNEQEGKKIMEEYMQEKHKFVEHFENQHLAAQLNQFTDMCHQASVNGGWWDNEPTMETFGTKIALIHSEISEAMEGLRKNKMDDHLPHRKMEEVELADALIRIFDYAGKRNLDLGGALIEKLTYNAKRADHKPENRAKDGGKKF